MSGSLPNRFAVISDIHGNSDALAAVLDDIDALGLDMVLNLGDHLSGPLAARETADMVMAREMVCISGNHDRCLVTLAPDDMGMSDHHAHAQLEEKHVAWLRALPATAVLGDAFLCHGTPASDTAYWLEAVSPDGAVSMNTLANIEVEARDIPQPLIFCGHTHIRRAIRLRDGRFVINPGSVGCPGYVHDVPYPHIIEAGAPAASYAVLERAGQAWRIAFRSIAYDSARMVGLARAAGQDTWANVLATGWVASGASD